MFSNEKLIHSWIVGVVYYLCVESVQFTYEISSDKVVTFNAF